MTSEVNQYIRSAIDAHPGAGAHEIAVAAAELIPSKNLRLCLAEALVDRVRIQLGNGRRNSMDNALSDSPKMRDRATWWAQMLTERVNVDGVWKTLGECSFDDLQACIDDREKLISRVSGQIENYKRLQKLMVEHGAKRVNDVPAQTEWKHAS